MEEKELEVNIGSLKINSKVSLAPMAGITDTILRQLIRKYSKTALLTTEMISSESLVQKPYGTILKYEKEEHPLIFQLSGHKPDLMSKAAKILEPMAAAIDINMGCPVNKVVKGTDGCSLMRNPKIASDIVKSIKDVVNVPVTCKFRLGWSKDEINFIEYAKLVESSGADFVTVHGRTRSQFYAGEADWNEISKLKGEINIPYFANGDITSVETAIECLKISKADGIAVGRATMGDPTLLHRIEHYLKTSEILEEPSLAEKIDILKEYILMETQLRGEEVGIKFVRKFYPHYIKGIRGGAEYRYNLVREESIDEIFTLLDRIKEIE